MFRKEDAHFKVSAPSVFQSSIIIFGFQRLLIFLIAFLNHSFYVPALFHSNPATVKVTKFLFN